ncbi:MAG: xylulokinase [Erysipelotrichaceae bacterium]|nr:xylulokinase [Erysipelotrichaceae bacterium]
MKDLLIGIDLGTTASKVVVFDKEGHEIASASEGYLVYYPDQGYAEQDPYEWWEAIATAIATCIDKGNIDPHDIKGIGIDGQSWSAIPIDKDGNVLANTPIWMDTRSAAICQELEDRIGKDKIERLSGNTLSATYSTGKILWYKENMPDMYAKIDKILQSNSYIVYRLTGKISQDISQAYGFHFFDIEKGVWDDDMREAMGIPASFIPPISNCDEVVGYVTEEAAKKCHLVPGIPVVAGGLDAAMGALGVGVLKEGQTQEYGGTSCGFSICMESFHYDPRMVLCRHVVPDKWLMQAGSNAGGHIMKWLQDQLGDCGKLIDPEKNTLDLYNELAEMVPAGSEGLVFLPYMNGERTPIWNPTAKGVWFGLDYNKTTGHLIRSAMEGVVFVERHNLDVAKSTGAKITDMLATGGSTKSRLWTQMKADVLQVPVLIPKADEATALGSAILAGVGVGVYDSYEEAIALTMDVKKRYEPSTKDLETYEKSYKLYREVYEATKHLMK